MHTATVEVLAECILSEKEVEAMDMFQGPLNMSFEIVPGFRK